MKEHLWLCLYQYKGMETEGHLFSDEKFICKAKDIIEALYKYDVWKAVRENKEPYDKSFYEYKRSEYAAGGWGSFAYKLDDENEQYRDDKEWFYKKYSKYNH